MGLAEFCTIGIGGPARHFVTARTCDDLRHALGWADSRSLPVFVLGGGSNVLFPDGEFPGLVIHVALAGLDTLGEPAEGRTVVRAAAGEDWNALVNHCVENGLQGVECLAGIPGQVGATPIQNVGAYGQEVADTIIRVHALDRSTGREVTLAAAECGFGYRTSRFKARDRNRFIVTAVDYALAPGGTPCTSYRDISASLEGAGVRNPTLQQVRDAVVEVRRAKAMVCDPGEPSSRSCGSFFTNPIIQADEAESVRAAAVEAGVLKPEESMPAFPCADGRVKLSAAWLIQRAGFSRGERRGNVGLSEKHVLALVNYGGGTAREILALAADIRGRVLARFGVLLEPEPVLAGSTLPS